MYDVCVQLCNQCQHQIHLKRKALPTCAEVAMNSSLCCSCFFPNESGVDIDDAVHTRSMQTSTHCSFDAGVT